MTPEAIGPDPELLGAVMQFDSHRRRRVTAKDFGDARYGIHLFSHEDDWGWTAYGHHDPRRLVAACIRDARVDDFFEDLREYAEPVSCLFESIERKWAVPVESAAGYDFELRWCPAETPGAIPVSVVTP